MRKLLALSAIALGVLAGATQAVSAAETPGGVGVQIHPQVGGGKLCLDATGDRDKDGVPIIAYACHGSENQKWTVTTSPNNQHAIIGLDGYCLDVRGGTSRASGTPVELYSCHFAANQRFALSADGRIREVESGKCLIAMVGKRGNPVVLDTCTNTPDEVFAIHHY